MNKSLNKPIYNTPIVPDIPGKPSVPTLEDWDVDRVEMGNGGNVHQLILALVNGG